MSAFSGLYWNVPVSAILILQSFLSLGFYLAHLALQTSTTPRLGIYLTDNLKHTILFNRR